MKHQNLMQKNLLISLVASLRRTPASTPMSSEHYWKKRQLTACQMLNLFTILELQVVLKEMRRNKCADTGGLVAECFIYGNLDLHKCLLDVFNNMLAVGRFDASWSHTVFTMLPKGGNLLSPSNWRPIAVLKITYKIFARLVYKRLRPTLERHQSKDQVGFRPCTSVEDAFVILESFAASPGNGISLFGLQA